MKRNFYDIGGNFHASAGKEMRKMNYCYDYCRVNVDGVGFGGLHSPQSLAIAEADSCQIKIDSILSLETGLIY